MAQNENKKASRNLKSDGNERQAGKKKLPSAYFSSHLEYNGDLIWRRMKRETRLRSNEP